MPSRERAPRDLPFDKGGELKRWAFLAAVTVWIFHPFASSRMIGTGDALWYSNMLADFVLQLRAGVFPVFVGQTEYAFNGAVYPLRVAPLYQHVGGVLDLLTGRHLSFFALQHLIVVSVGLAGLVTCYVCLVDTAPRRRWSAALLSALYLTCPGVLGVIFIQDLYMSWMTLPFLPLVVYGTIRSYQRDDLGAWLAIAVGLGGTWLAHAPIALWMTGIVSVAQILRLTIIHRTWPAWRRALAGALILVALGHYPFVSVALLRSPDIPSPVNGGLEHPERIVTALQAAFPGCLLPLTTGAGQLSDLQLGYGLAVVLGLGGAAFALRRNWVLGFLLIAAIGIVLIVLPVPGWSEFFWLKLVPGTVRQLTFYWPMHRLYLVLATVVVFAGLIGLDALAAPRSRVELALLLLLGAGCGWSLWESRQFIEAGRVRTASAEDTARKQRAENRLLMTHAYGLFAKLPPYFSNGVVDPSAEFRLLDPTTKQPLPSPTDTTVQAEGSFQGTIDANPGILNLSPTLLLEPGKRYDLNFVFHDPDTKGILQLIGSSFFREYVLPRSGEPRAFGTRSPNAATLPLWTTGDHSETVQLRFIPTAENSISDYSHFAEFRLVERALTAPIDLQRLVPFVGQVTATTPALLETPRMATPGYQAWVNGQPVPVQTSSEVLIALPVPAGKSDVILRFVAPPLLQLSYWTTLLAWITLLATLAVMHYKRRKARETP